ncbi:MAG: 16S rRNA (guanine(966)-N(2))-methyltransferase RsmD [candidate division NC10 bacterium]|nr:16S rRNA (guanine(966)-N(2))-methyltransferase RsmD [candidate division NC10 bacterium]
MRIIAGTLRGRQLRGAKRLEIRPTSDYLKEVLFDVLQSKMKDARFLDLFAGSGNVGIEALSRGAREVVFVDSSHRSIELIRANLEAVGMTDRATLLRADAMVAMRKLKHLGRRFSVVFLDPPYRSGLLIPALRALPDSHLLEEQGILVVEHFHKQDLPQKVAGLLPTRQIRHGESRLSFYMAIQGSGGE